MARATSRNSMIVSTRLRERESHDERAGEG
jgi:hypothetical protein